MTKKLMSGVAVSLSVLLAPLASATVMDGIYSVGNTSVVNCSSGGNGYAHGLWTNSVYGSGGDCGQYFSFNLADAAAGDPGTLMELDSAAGMARLAGSATNRAGIVASFYFEFDNFGDNPDTLSREIKTGGGPDYDRNNPYAPDWDFYHSILSGIISFDDGTDVTTYHMLMVGQSAPGTPSTDMPVLQVGHGANDKDGANPGASVWLEAYTDANYTNKIGGHWDLNMNLFKLPDDTSFPPPPAIPVPATPALFGLGVAALAMLRRRRMTR